MNKQIVHDSDNKMIIIDKVTFCESNIMYQIDVVVGNGRGLKKYDAFIRGVSRYQRGKQGP